MTPAGWLPPAKIGLAWRAGVLYCGGDFRFPHEMTAMAFLYALGPVFLAVFLAELGDKTQLATMLFASQKDVHPLGVFVASAAALVLSSAIAVFVGALAARYIEGVPLKLFAGIGFVAIGGWMVFEHFRAAA